MYSCNTDITDLSQKAECALNLKDYQTASFYYNQICTDVPNPNEEFQVRLQERAQFCLKMIQSLYDVTTQIEQYHDLNGHLTRGYVYIQLKDYESALLDINFFLTQFPQHTRAHYMRGLTFEGIGKLEEALNSYTVAMQYNEQNNYMDPTIYIKRAELYEHINKKEQALYDYNRAFQLVPNDGNVLYKRALLAFDMDEFGIAQESFTMILGFNPNDTDSILKLGIISFKLKQHQKALEYFNDFFLKGGRSFDAFLYQGKCLVILELLDAAVNSLTEALQFRPKDPDALRERGGVFFMLRAFDKALCDLTEVILQQPENPEAWYRRAVLHATQRDYYKAVNDYKASLRCGKKDLKGLKATSGLIKATSGLISVLTKLGRYENALKVCEYAFITYPHPQNLNLLQFRKDLLAKLSGEKKKSYKESVLVLAQGGNIDAQFDMGLRCEKESNTVEALMWFKMVSKKGGGGEVQYKMAKIYGRGAHGVERDMEQAKYWLEASAKQKFVPAMIALANIFNGDKTDPDGYKKAAELYLKVIEKKDDPDVLYKLGTMFLTGHGVEKNVDSARNFLSRARTKKHPQAKILLDSLKVSTNVRSRFTSLLSWSKVNKHRGQISREQLSESDIKYVSGDLTLLFQIGKGATATVYEAELNNNKRVAVKRVYVDTRDSELRARLDKEASLMQQLKHPNIVEFYGIRKLSQYYFIVMEFMEYGSLDKGLKERTLSGPQRIAIMKDTAYGLNYLHSKDILHRDIKPQNVLYGSDSEGKVVAKLTDFGESRKWDRTMTMNTGTVDYMAPEVIQGREYNTNADVYSYGILFCVTVSQEEPYKSVNQYMVPGFVMEGGRPDIPVYCPELIRDIITKCWDKDPEQRPSMSEVVDRLANLRAEDAELYEEKGELSKIEELDSTFSQLDVSGNITTSGDPKEKNYREKDDTVEGLSKPITPDTSGEVVMEGNNNKEKFAANKEDSYRKRRYHHHHKKEFTRISIEVSPGKVNINNFFHQEEDPTKTETSSSSSSSSSNSTYSASKEALVLPVLGLDRPCPN